MLGDPETSKAPAGQLMSEESSLASKWVAASVEHLLPAGVDTLQAGGAGEGPSSASAVPGTVLMETAGVGGGGG